VQQGGAGRTGSSRQELVLGYWGTSGSGQGWLSGRIAEVGEQGPRMLAGWQAVGRMAGRLAAARQ